MTRPAHESLNFYTGYQRERVADTRSNLWTVGASYTRVEDGSDWLQTYAINYEQEDYEVGGERRTSKLVIPSFTDRKSTRLNSSHVAISYAVFCLKKKNTS